MSDDQEVENTALRAERDKVIEEREFQRARADKWVALFERDSARLAAVEAERDTWRAKHDLLAALLSPSQEP